MSLLTHEQQSRKHSIKKQRKINLKFSINSQSQQSSLVDQFSNLVRLDPRLIIGLVWVLVESSRVSPLRAIANVTADICGGANVAGKI